MRILHTSDWHLGQRFYSYDRTEEYLHFFEQLRLILTTEHPDALLISGDIFDNSIPTITIQRLFVEIIVGLCEQTPDMEVVIIAGNHDSGNRLEIDEPLWVHHHVHVLGTRHQDLHDHIIPLGDKGTIVAVPYISPLNYPSDITDFYNDLHSLVPTDKPAVLMAHTTIQGCDIRGHKSLFLDTDIIGGIECVPTDIFGDYDYIALGHIHHRQHIGKAYYCGSPFAISFDEDYPHGLNVVDIDSSVHVRQIPITPLVPLITFPSEPTPFPELLSLLTTFDTNCYLRTNIFLPPGTPPPTDYREQIEQTLSGKLCKYCTPLFPFDSTTSSEDTLPSLTADELRELSITDILTRFFTNKGIDTDTQKEYIRMLQQLDDTLCNS